MHRHYSAPGVSAIYRILRLQGNSALWGTALLDMPGGMQAVLSSVMQGYTQYGGLRPFGVSLLYAGWDAQNKCAEVEDMLVHEAEGSGPTSPSNHKAGSGSGSRTDLFSRKVACIKNIGHCMSTLLQGKWPLHML